MKYENALGVVTLLKETGVSLIYGIFVICIGAIIGVVLGTIWVLDAEPSPEPALARLGGLWLYLMGLGTGIIVGSFVVVGRALVKFIEIEEQKYEKIDTQHHRNKLFHKLILMIGLCLICGIVNIFGIVHIISGDISLDNVYEFYCFHINGPRDGAKCFDY